MRGKMVAYEGVVLPGGKVVLGRWWDAKQTPVAEVMEGVVGGSFRYERADLGRLICAFSVWCPGGVSLTGIRVRVGPFLFWAKE